METISTSGNQTKAITIIVVLFSSLLFTLLLFYIDEGKYNLVGLFKSQNIGGLIFYFGWILGFILLVSSVLRKKIKKSLSLLISAIAGPILGLAVLFGIVTLLSLL